jgi:hypothetical protein
MTISFSLADLTVIGLSPPGVELPPDDMAKSQHALNTRPQGFARSESRKRVQAALRRDPKMLSATKSAMAETGVGVLDIELVRITPDIDVAGLEPFPAVGAELNARYVITAPYDADLTRLADRLAAIDDPAVRYGL